MLDEDTFFSRLPPKEEVVGHSFEIIHGDALLLNELALNLSNLGYRRQRQVKEIGDFVVRGVLWTSFHLVQLSQSD